MPLFADKAYPPQTRWASIANFFCEMKYHSPAPRFKTRSFRSFFPSHRLRCVSRIPLRFLGDLRCAAHFPAVRLYQPRQARQVAVIEIKMDINKHTHDTSVASAETQALSTQAAEAEAEQRFDTLHAKLASAGRAHEATNSNEFRQWLEARAHTDDAWGRWAVAMDATVPG